MNGGELNGLILRARGLGVLRGVLDSPASRSFLTLLGLLDGRPDPSAVANTFGKLWEELATGENQLLPDAWRAHLVTRLLDDENAFSLGAETGRLSSVVLEQAGRDLRTLRVLFDLDAETLLGMVEDAVPELARVWTPWHEPIADGKVDDPLQEARLLVARKLSGPAGWDGMAEMLVGHYAAHGAGAFGRHGAFRWEEGGLRGVAHPDGVRLSALIGYGRERGPLLRNTERLLDGLPAHHALLYGPPGTGKSSTVKAVAKEYASRGLRLVEVAKEDLGALPRLLNVLRGRGLRFILFVDDLSFEEGEVEYKALKALLEGSVEEPPENVRVYATSNRRNLIREGFSDRNEADDVHAHDTMREKLSLVARFGLRLTFHAPDQKEYLEIVEGLANERGLGLSGEELRERALMWERWRAGRSGRTARQFVDELQAELGCPGE